MPLYNEENIQGSIDLTRYEYAYKVDMSYPLEGVPQVVFRTATVELNNDTGVSRMLEHKRNLQMDYTGNATFDLIVPGTGDKVGEMDYDTYFLATYSLFFHTASEVDS